ncbi:MAG: rod shape-determining protein MreD [Pseudomonadota bacterium]|nr:rod shape-determining protein MreD [Pseudomonadota bacterium]
MTDRFIDVEFSQARWLVITSYLLGLVIDTMMIMQQGSILAPPFSLLILLYWTAQFIKNTHFISAFILGLLMDAMLQTTLGAHSLIFIVLTFIMLRYRLLFRSHSVLQQALVIGFYLLFYQFLSLVMFSPALDEEQTLLFWLMPAVTMVVWPFVALILRWLTRTLIHQ